MIIEARDDVVSLSGSLQSNLWPAIRAAANLLLRLHPNGILIDASQITSISEDGARTFMDAMQYIERHSARIVVCHPPQAVKDVIKHVPGIRSQLPIAETTEEGRISLELASSTRRQVRADRIDVDTVRPRLVMLPLTDDPTGLSEAIGLALAMGAIDGEGEPGKRSMIPPLLHFLYVIEVPRSMPITAPFTEQENAAREALDRAIKLADSAGASSQTGVSRSRDIGEEIAEQAAKMAVEIIFLTMPSRGGGAARDRFEPIIDTVLQKARCEVVVKNFPYTGRDRYD